MFSFCLLMWQLTDWKLDGLRLMIMCAVFSVMVSAV